jgi:hypothetical protein
MSITLAGSGFLLIPNYKIFTKHSYLPGLFSHFNFYAFALMISAAILEELGFRAFFTKSRYLFIIGVSMFLTNIEASIYYRFVTKLKIAYTPHALLSSYVKIIYFLPENMILISIAVIVLNINIPKYIMNHKYYFILISSIFFALSHTTGLWATSVPWYFPLFFVLPQFVGGILLCLIRIKYNLISSIIVHFCFDFSLLIDKSAATYTDFTPVVHNIFLAVSIIALFGFYVFGLFNFIFLLKNKGSVLLAET